MGIGIFTASLQGSLARLYQVLVHHYAAQHREMGICYCRRMCRSLAIRGLYANLGAGVLVTSCMHPFSTQYGRKRMSLPQPACTDVELASKFAEARGDRWRISLVCMRRRRRRSLCRLFMVYVNMEMATKGLLRDCLERHAEHHGDPQRRLEFRQPC